MILAIDTSSDQASIALAAQDRLVAEISWSQAGSHAHHLLPCIHQMMTRQGVSFAAVSGIAVAVGPGSFSGLRVGISAAKGIAFGRGIPLVGIPTFDAVSFQAPIAARILTVLPAGRGRYYSAVYKTAADSRQCVAGPTLFELADVCEWATEVDSIVGNVGQDLENALRQRSGVGPIQFEPCRLRRAGFLAELGRRYFEHDGLDQIDTVEPLYLQLSAAEERLLPKSESNS